jgi:hypothetical protein
VRASLLAFAFATAAAAEIECVVDAETGLDSCELSQPEWVARYTYDVSGPEQRWVNLASKPTEMTIGWVTAETDAESIVSYGTTRGGPYPFTSTGTSDSYTYSSSYTSGLIHHATLTGLKLNTPYYYVLGAADAQSSEASFNSSRGVGAVYPYTLAAIGDLGESANAQKTVDHLVAGFAYIDAIAFNGDISYASGCEKSGCSTWDALQRMMEPVTQTIPTQIEIGNHEMSDKANGISAISSQYRFAGMPFGSRTDKAGQEGVFFFSYEDGPMHAIVLASFPTAYGFDAASPMTTWLKADLASIDRSQTPWIVVNVHAPWYNSNTKHTRDGNKMQTAYEALFIEYKVNIVYSGHVHAYQRSCPVNANVCQNDGEGIVHVTSGDGGAGLYTKWVNQPAWSMVQRAEFGHSELTFVNSTHAHHTWHRHVDAESKITDDAWLVNWA